MSWWIYLEDDSGESVIVDSHSDGGTYCVGGTSSAELNMTYNYSKPLALAQFDIRLIDGKRASECIGEMQRVVRELGAVRDSDYWKPTNGNAGAAIKRLCDWAKQHPQAKWRVS